ncbi:MAG: DUF3087 domain-containing protein [Gammaproteobacteria bacterium]|nr:DUF3087 domain-containing protein [Gammaproteobacteria bacterium]MBT8133570.1 DUF3087 domain-containing protein [Gammaproteobacteria bacterium]NNJ50360.1 DUF3087 domain-containing protein [Gammaproteobacteria bacterium]
MQLIEIDKFRYRKHLRIVFAAIAIALAIIAIGSSTLIIHFFSTPDVDHFWHNLTGVVIAAIVVALILNKLRSHPFMFEVVYVWELKQQLNRIHRKMKNIEKKIDNNDHDAMVIMNYMYKGSKQLYQLDDNTITMSTLNSKIKALDKRMEDAGMDTSTDSYTPGMLERF